MQSSLKVFKNSSIKMRLYSCVNTALQSFESYKNILYSLGYTNSNTFIALCSVQNLQYQVFESAFILGLDILCAATSDR